MAYVKFSPAEHPEAALVEAAGLSWLSQAAAAGGARVVPVLSASRGCRPGSGVEHEPGRLVLEEMAAAAPDLQAGLDFGRALARTHGWLAATGSGLGFGSLPPEHPAQTPAYFGPAEDPLAMGTGVHSSWGAFMAQDRLDPVLQPLHEEIPAAEAQLLDTARERIASGDLDDAEPASLIHGDLWSGNVLWSPRAQPMTPEQSPVQAVLIDPSAHAGHRETDIALLHLFGLPQLDAVLEGYQQVSPLRAGWQDRIGLHQFFCLTVHWRLFGAGYRSPTLEAAEEILAL
ncbi:fructosamine kinase family protein [Nesterenkonia lutea]|uniref:Fructosamine-3-kinase n=1 Tax=Nesterenkonia lutea TaxID=272919 RepID=A0ABR9JB29_9MICC|nr:fructosamine kinase family protein [Nesterenkonia lutea]MBE1523133.1 fructosamine-3-kinase [Nesterenkonia lutea]